MASAGGGDGDEYLVELEFELELEEPSDFVRQLRATMVEKGWKQNHLAAHLRVTQGTISTWLRGGVCKHEAEMLRRLALDEPETPEPPPEPMQPPSEFVRQLRAAMVEKGWKKENLHS